jgi:hypothetical protein
MSSLFDSMQALLATLLPATAQLYLWGAVSGILAILIFHLLTDYRRLEAVKAEAGRARMAALHFDGDFGDLGPVIKKLLGNSLHGLWLRLIPVACAVLPFLILMPWAETQFGYELPAAGEQIQVRVAPPTEVLISSAIEPAEDEGDYRLLWPDEGHTVDIRDGGDLVLITLPPAVAKSAIDSKAWWNSLLDLPPYLPADSPVKRLELGLAARNHSQTKYAFVNHWDFHFTVAACIAALMGYSLLRIMRSRRHKQEENSAESSAVSFSVDPATQLLGMLAGSMPALWVGMGRIESRLLRSRLKQIEVDRPVFVTGLARAGTTLLLEFLADLPGVATHRYRDYPFAHVPYWWNRFVDMMPRPKEASLERSHRDGIYVTSDSPEAMEEILWMAFFDDIHNVARSNVLDSGCANGEFADFFRDSIKKLLLVRGCTRYVSKGNYNVTRLACLLSLFPDARIVIPVRHPVSHIASVIKQDRLFAESLEDNPAARAYLKTVGHFEFGPLRKPINTGDNSVIERIRSCWKDGDEIRGWAIYWSSVYGHLLRVMESDQKVAQASSIVRYEDLCAQPESALSAVVTHCEFVHCEEYVERFAPRVRFPTYYQHGFQEDEIDIIEQECAAVAARFGYQDFRHSAQA